MHLKTLFAALGAAALFAACSDRGPTSQFEDSPTFRSQNVAGRATLLTDVPVTGTLPGGTFSGTFTITHFAEQGDQIVASGVVTGTALVGGVETAVTQAFADIPVDLAGHHSQCAIVNLDLGPLHLDVLGLVVDLNEVVLDLTAVSGPGNLLGNLLCAVTNLLNPGGGLLGAIQNLLDQINALLA